MKVSLINIDWAVRNPPATSGFTAEQTWFLSQATTCDDRHGMAYADATIRKHPNLGHFGADLQPKADGTLDLELGLLLPDLYPNLADKQEYCVQIRLHNTDRHLCVSNQMAMVRYTANARQHHVIIPRTSINLTPEKASKATLSHVQHLKTCVSCRFVVKGVDAEDALESNIRDAITNTIAILNQFASANLMVMEKKIGVLTPVYDPGTFDFVYILMKGKRHQICTSRLATNVPKVLLHATEYTEEECKRLLSLLRGDAPIDDLQKLLQSARIYISGGMLQFALLQLVITAEVATMRFVHKRLAGAGVSKKKLKDYGNDITFSHMLNLYLPLLCPSSVKGKVDTIGTINWGRDARNDLMHNGVFTATSDQLRRLLAATEDYLLFLSSDPT